MTRLLARYAESIFWLARYMERVENLARILDVTETFARDTRESNSWLSVVQINADERGFFERYPTATAESVTNFYVLDRENPNSIVSTLGFAR
ncbi:MAG TPA: alpha-E domain-containing protein, partial [Pseudonocardiaceae bacterium]